MSKNNIFCTYFATDILLFSDQIFPDLTFSPTAKILNLKKSP